MTVWLLFIWQIIHGHGGPLVYIHDLFDTMFCPSQLMGHTGSVYVELPDNSEFKKLQKLQIYTMHYRIQSQILSNVSLNFLESFISGKLLIHVSRDSNIELLKIFSSHRYNDFFSNILWHDFLPT